MRCMASLSLSSAPTCTIQPVRAEAGTTGLMAPFCCTATGGTGAGLRRCGCGLAGAAYAIACAGAGAGGAAATLEAGSTPSTPLPVP